MNRRPGCSLAGSVLVSAALAISATGASAMNVTATGESGACTLRGAIAAVAANDSGTSCGTVLVGEATPINLPANTYTPVNGTIVVPASTNIEINGDNINNPLTTVIDGTGGVAGRVFEIKNGAAVKLSGLTVTGGRALDGGPPTGIFASYSGENGGGILNQGNLTLDHVVVSENQAGHGGDGMNGGLEQSGGNAGWGGNGGGIYNADNASLTITNSRIEDNNAGNGGTGGIGGNGVGGLGHNPDGRAGGNGGRGGSGGGIFNSNFGNLTIDRTTISGNQSGRGGSGGGGGMGAGPSPAPPPSTGEFSGGKGGDGGDGGNNGRQLRKDGNPAFDEALGGGGVYNVGYLTITNSTISGNNTGAGGNGGPSGAGGKRNSDSNVFQTSGRAGWAGGGGRGGGLLNGSWQQGSMSLVNVTVTGNLTGDGGNGGGGAGGSDNTLGGGLGGTGGDGGGIWAQGAHNNITSLTHVTIVKNFVGVRGLGGGSANNSSAGPGVRGVGAGIAVGGRYNPSGAGVYMKRTLISANGFSGDPTYDKNCSQAQPIENYQEFVDQGNNLSFPQDGSPCPGKTNVDPDLGLLGNYGGPTETIVPQPGSAAIGGVPLASCDVATDQRGMGRPGDDGTSCDIGAVEVGAAPEPTPTTIQVVSSLQPSKTGQSVTYTATVAPPPSSGTVAFRDGGVAIPGCEATPLTAGGKFTCSLTYSAAGTHSITASYTGNSLFKASVSPAITQTVTSATQPPTGVPKIATVTVTGPSKSKKGNLVTFNVKVTNSGKSRATGVKVKASGAGSEVTRLIGDIPASGAKTVQVPVRMKQTGQKKITFRVTSANAGGKTVTKKVKVRK